jgi:REP element-mobilizing transposase RayT
VGAAQAPKQVRLSSFRKNCLLWAAARASPRLFKLWIFSHTPSTESPIYLRHQIENHRQVASNPEPGSKALRKGRVSVSGQIYIVTFVTDRRYPYFLELRLARSVTCALNRTAGQATLCHVVMPDHVHWLLELKVGSSLSRVVQACKSRSAHEINNALQRCGRVWQAGFHDHALRTEESVVEAARYIVANPIRAGLCEKVEQYSHWDAVWV